MYSKIIGVIAAVLVAASFVACGGNDNQIHALQTQVAQLKVEVNNTRNGVARVDTHVDTQAVWVNADGHQTNNPDRRPAFPTNTFRSKMEMAQHYLAAGQPDNAKYLLESAVSDLGIGACHDNLFTGRYVLEGGPGIPLEVQKLGADLAPLFVFSVDPKTGWTVIDYTNPHPTYCN